MTEVGDKTATLLASLWLRNRPLVEERLAELDRTAAQAAAGTLPADLREAARHTAHKLAGSLGMYGYAEGTHIARQIELLLGEAAPDAKRLGALAAELRRTIFPEGQGAAIYQSSERY